jgi:phosphate uptake regulator
MTETRKIQKTGGSTYIVSIPKRWMTDSQLTKGDEVTLDVTVDGMLNISPGTRKETVKLKKQMDVTDKNDSKALLRELIGCYVTGYDIIEIRSKHRISSEIRKTIQDFTRRVIGPEIIEEGSDSIIIQDVADHADLAMKKIVRRMHLMSRVMLSEALQSIKELDAELAKAIIARDDEVDRLHWFVEKQHSMTCRNPSFAAKMKIDMLESNSMLMASKALERIADHATRIAHSVNMLGSSRISDETMNSLDKLGEKAMSLLDKSVDAFFRKDQVTANECIEETSELREDTSEFLGRIMKQKGKIAVGLAFIAESLERVGGYSADIAEMAINLAE